MIPLQFYICNAAVQLPVGERVQGFGVSISNLLGLCSTHTTTLCSISATCAPFGQSSQLRAIHLRQDKGPVQGLLEKQALETRKGRSTEWWKLRLRTLTLLSLAIQEKQR